MRVSQRRRRALRKSCRHLKRKSVSCRAKQSLSPSSSPQLSAQAEASKQQSVSKAANSRSNAPAAAARGEDGVLMKLKEDLYSDLTGLMIRGVKRSPEEDVYDCIQTGRNGSKSRTTKLVSLYPLTTPKLSASTYLYRTYPQSR